MYFVRGATKSVMLTTETQLSRGQNDLGASLSILLSLIFVGAGVIALLILVAAAHWYYKRSRRQATKLHGRVGAKADATLEDGPDLTQPVDASSTLSQYGATDMTAVVTTHEISVPLFLQVDMGTDYRRDRQIAHGAMGSVCMVHIYTGSQMRARANSAAVVGKFATVPVSELSNVMRDAFYQELSIHWMFRDTDGFARIYGYSEVP